MHIVVTAADILKSYDLGKVDGGIVPAGILKVRPILRESGVITSKATVEAYIRGFKDAKAKKK